MPMKTEKCPLCDSLCMQDAGFCSEKNLAKMGEVLCSAPPTVKLPDYALFKCTGCRFEFSLPAVAPDAELYLWLTRSGFPYPELRWEWEACAELLENEVKQRHSAAVSLPLQVLDFGSGDGKFLRRLGRIPGIRAIGMDHNPDVVADSRQQGLEVMEANLCADTFRQQFPEGVHMITLWHVVEHVPDPVDLLQRAKQLLKTDGALCFSVPLSPMSYEHSWPDPFNAPPHHLSRWNVDALQALAKRLDMQMSLDLPEAEPLLARVLHALVLQAAPAFGKCSRWGKLRALIVMLVKNPGRIAKEIRLQLAHPKRDGKPLPDVAMITLRRRSQ